MLLGARQFFERRGAPTPPLPYDAEVQYLESTGTQWIDTGLPPRKDTIIDVRFQKTGTTDSGLALPFYTYTSRAVFVGVFGRNVSGNYMFTGCADTNVNTLAPVDLLWHEAEIILARPRQVIFDGVQKFSIDSEMSRSPTITNKLFAYANSSTVAPTNLGIGRIASFSVTDATTGEKIQDLIPVRKNGVGYMYDRVSGQLLGNGGTGNFVLGPDKPYDNAVGFYNMVDGKLFLEEQACLSAGPKV